MSSVQYLKEFINQRLTAAAEEIFGVLEKNIVEYEEEVDRQRKLLDIVLKPEIKLHRIDLPQQHVCQEEEVLTDQQLCNQERNSSLDQEDPEPPQIEEEQEEICSSQEGEQLVLKQDTDTFMLTSDHEETDHSEPEPGSDHQLLSHNSPVAESQDQRGSKHEDSGSTRNTEPKPQKIDFKKTAEEISGVNTIVEYEEEVDRQHRLLDIIWKPEIKLHRIDLPQQHVCMEEEVLTDQQLCNQERNSSLDQEDPEPLLIKEEQEEICSSQEGEQLVLKQETDTFMLTSDDEETDHSEPEPGSDHQLLSHSSPVAESQDQRGSKHEDSGSTRNAEPTPQKRQNGNSGHSDKAFKQKHPLKRHLKTHMGKKLHSCETCGKGFLYMSGLVGHLRTHTNEKPHSCNTCGKRLGYMSSLKRHMRVHTGEKPYSCKMCGKSFRHGNTLKVHMRTHTGEKPYSCKICGKNLSTPKGLVIHMRYHTGEKLHSCEICGKGFVYMSALKAHIRTHTGEKPHSCNTCGKRFGVVAGLIRHMNVHTEMPYLCKKCGKGFRAKDVLLIHMRTHTGEKPHSCNTCGKRFISMPILTRHERTHICAKPVRRVSALEMACWST